jgi:phytoene dehydrogenase-like protein
MGIHVSLGVARDLSNEPHALILGLDKPVEIAGETRDRFYIQLFGFDPSLAPKGSSVIRVLFPTSYRRWQDLANDDAAYQAEKRRIADTVIAQLETRFPDIARQVEAVDVATPITTFRFTGNAHGYKASVVSLFLGMIFGRTLSQTLPSLANFYMVGQWAGGGGVSGAAAMGRNVARAICEADRCAFVAAKPANASSAPVHIRAAA